MRWEEKRATATWQMSEEENFFALQHSAHGKRQGENSYDAKYMLVSAKTLDLSRVKTSSPSGSEVSGETRTP